MSIRLWLDDERPMPASFDRHVKTASEAIEVLATGEVSLASLDHDLGLYGPGSDGRTGYDVAKWIEEQAVSGLLKPLTVMVHSQNVVGRHNMVMALKNAKRAWMEAGRE